MMLRPAAEVLVVVLLGELDEQDGLRIAAHHRVGRRLEHGDVARQAEHGAVDQFDRDRPELDQVLGRVHGLEEAAEVAGADRAAAEQRRKLQLDLGREAERAFRADEQVREIDVVAARDEGVDVVAADPALDLREAHLDHAGLAGAEREQIGRQRLERRGLREVGEIGRDRAEMRRRSVCQQRVDRNDVLAGIAVAQRACAAGIVAHHAADGGARCGRDVDWKPQAVRLEPAVELIEHDAGLDDAAPAGDVELDHMVEMFRAVDDQRRIDGLARLRGAAAARQHAHALLARQRQRVLDLLHRARHHHADRHHLVMRGVGGVAPARERIERHLAQESGLEPPFEPRHRRVGHLSTVFEWRIANGE